MSMLDDRADVGWLQGDGPDSDVVLSSRARLARNIAGFPFVNRSTDNQRSELVMLAKRAIMGAQLDDHMLWIELKDASADDRRLLFERHVISNNLAQGENRRAVAISGDESLSIMVNEEDHLRMQMLKPGFQLPTALQRINEVDDAIESSIDYAFSSRWGYLTACPTNVGTGLRLGVMVHLPALKLTNEIDRLRRAAKDLHLAVRGFYGEGSDSAGDFYQVSNQVTLGCSQQDLLDEFTTKIVPRLIDYERVARDLLLDQKLRLLDDRVHRAMGILQNARLLSEDEAMKLLSRVRLGVCTRRLQGVDRQKIDRLFLRVQSAHLQAFAGEALSADEQREVRATIVRQVLTGSNPASQN